MSRYRCHYVLYLLVWLALAVTPVAIAILSDGGTEGMAEVMERFLAKHFP